MESPLGILTSGVSRLFLYTHNFLNHMFPRFDDGSVVLRAKDPPTLFRVHRAMIARHSEVFRHMFLIPQPEHRVETETIEGCPVVDLHDSASDMSSLLRALYDGP